MYLRDIYNNNKIVKSFEVFPPKKEYDVTKLYETIKDLKPVNPDFVSVTYGAGGTTRDRTVEIASYIKNNLNIEVVAHFTCVNTSKEQIITVLDDLKEKNIKNILALRGDPPQDQSFYNESFNDFKYAYKLVEFIKKYNDWSIAVAGYPEGHQESKSLEDDINYLKLKVDSGADLIITQLFFDNNDFYRFRDLAVKKGINVPIVPGIFPILNYNAITKITSLCGAKIPFKLNEKLDANKDFKDEIEKIGIEYAVNQINDLLKNNLPGIHFYTMNKSLQIKEIFNQLDI